MKKRLVSISVIVLVIILALFVLSACNATDTEDGVNLINNGDFENYITNSDSTITFSGWTLSKDNWSSSKSQYSRKNTEREQDKGITTLGDSYLYIVNSSASFVYFSQSVKVDRRAVYKVTVDIKVDSTITTGTDETYKGAYVTFLENTGYYFVEQTKASTVSSVKNNDYWQTLTFYVKPMNTDYMTIALCLGAEGATSVGHVSYDNVTMAKVDASAVADGYSVTNFKKATVARYNSDVSGILFVTFLSLFSVALLVGAYIIVRRLYAQKHAFLSFDESGATPAASKKGGKGGNQKTKVQTVWYKNPWFIAGMLVLGTFLVRLIFLLSMYGFGSEMNYTVNLAKLMGVKGGIINAYATHGSTLQSTSPGALYILAIIGAMGQNMEYSALSILIRMVNVIGDMAVVAMIYFYGRKYVGDRLSTIYAAVYSLLPITLMMSGLNNSFESLFIALIVASFILVVEKKYLPTYLVMTLAVLLDIRALAVAPLVVAYMGYMYYKDDDDRKKFTKNRAMIVFGLVGAFVLLYALTVPVAFNYIKAGKAFYGFTLIANEMTKNTLFVDNALGVYGMAGMNQKTSSSTASVLNLIFILVLVAYVISLYVKNKNRQELIMLASFTFAVIAVFSLKVSFTYLFIALALGLIYTMISGEKRMYIVMAGYSLLTFLCVGQLINNSGFAVSEATGYFVNFETTSPDFIIFCVLAVLNTLYYAYVTYSIANNGKLVDIKPMNKKFPEAFKDGFNKFAATFKKSNED